MKKKKAVGGFLGRRRSWRVPFFPDSGLGFGFGFDFVLGLGKGGSLTVLRGFGVVCDLVFIPQAATSPRADGSERRLALQKEEEEEEAAQGRGDLAAGL
jgi:hypothetical protein